MQAGLEFVFQVRVDFAGRLEFAPERNGVGRGYIGDPVRTAQALAGDSAVTDEKTAPAGPFTVDDVHCDPFQCSSAELVVSGTLATAQASVAESALTEKTSKPFPDTAAGRADGVQFVPSQRIIIACTGPAPPPTPV